MLRKLFTSLVICGALLTATSISASAATGATTAPAPTSGQQEVISLGPNQTSATAVRPMRPEVCQFLLRSHPGHTTADCVNHYTFRMAPAKRPPASTAAPFAWNCPATGYATMWNFGWYASVSQNFCVSGSYVYPNGTDCSNYGGIWPTTVSVTWCGGARSGYRADGGENVYIGGPPPGNYGAGLRIWFDAAYRSGFYCWNAGC
jgi:hypothetical protein